MSPSIRRAHRAAVVLALAITSIATSGALAAKPSGGGGGHRNDPPCVISPSAVVVGQVYVVSVSGLPTGTAINLWVTDPNGSTTGSPLGSTPDGSFNLDESSSSAGMWTYAFSGPTKQQNTTVYATCSVSAA